MHQHLHESVHGLFFLSSDTSSVTKSQIAKVLMDEQDVQVLLSSRIVDLLNGTSIGLCYCSSELANTVGQY